MALADRINYSKWDVATREPVVQAYLAWGDPLGAPGNELGQLHFDVVISEEHSRTTEITTHSVETGKSITDHVRPNPDKLTLEVFVSNTPIFSSDGQNLPLTLLLPKPNDSVPLDPLTLNFPQPGQTGLNPLLDATAGGTSGLLDRFTNPRPVSQTLPGARVTPFNSPDSVTADALQFSGDIDYVQNTLNTLTRLRNTATLLSVSTPRQHYQNMVLDTITMKRDAQTGTAAMFTLTLQEIRIVSSTVVDAPLPSIPRAAPAIDKGTKDVTPADANKQKQSLIRRFVGNVFGP